MLVVSEVDLLNEITSWHKIVALLQVKVNADISDCLNNEFSSHEREREKGDVKNERGQKENEKAKWTARIEVVKGRG